MPVMKEERETLIRLDHHDNTVHIYSTEPYWWRKCESLGMTLDVDTKEADKSIARQYLGPLKRNIPGTSLKSLLGQASKRGKGTGFGARGRSK
jgi:hypothetical protein